MRLYWPDRRNQRELSEHVLYREIRAICHYGGVNCMRDSGAKTAIAAFVRRSIEAMQHVKTTRQFLGQSILWPVYRIALTIMHQ